jgi:DNA-binding PadR family transcriptional regulator
LTTTPVSPSSLLPLKPDVFMILLALARRPRHGYGIMRDVDERTDGTVILQTGALYRALKRMLDDGLIQGCNAPSDADTADARRRYYRLTRFGATVLDAEADRMAGLVRAARLAALGKRPRLA